MQETLSNRIRQNPLWAYGGGLLALVGATILMGMNISAALGGDPALWPTILRVGGAVLGDVAAACLPFAVVGAHRNGTMGLAVALALIWAGGCAYTVYSATEWNISQNAAVRNPVERAQWQEATAKGTYEQQIKLALEKLSAANRAAIEGKSQTVRSDAMVTAKRAEIELERLRANPPEAPKELRGTVRQAFSEWPWFWPVMLLVFSQAGWAVLAVAETSRRANHEPVQVEPVGSGVDQGRLTVVDVEPATPRPTNVIQFRPAHGPAGPVADQDILDRAGRMSQRAIAAELGVSRSRVQRTIKRLDAAATA